VDIVENHYLKPRFRVRLSGKSYTLPLKGRVVIYIPYAFKSVTLHFVFVFHTILRINSDYFLKQR
jgi:hypothetical protein